MREYRHPDTAGKKRLEEHLNYINGSECVYKHEKMYVDVKLEETGEYDDFHQPIRERTVSEETMEAIAEEYGWTYNGEIDVVSDYRVKDEFVRSHRF